eukprot:4914772-Prymnesium_polylepis.1
MGVRRGYRDDDGDDVEREGAAASAEPPGHAADHPGPTQPTLSHKAVRGARARSSQHQLHIA